jgi:hypothetical protein
MGQAAVRLENDRVCVFDRDGVYQARIKIGTKQYIWRSLKTHNQNEALSGSSTVRYVSRRSGVHQRNSGKE